MDEVDVIRPPLTGWNFASRERELFATAKQLPTWRVANQSRKFLAAIVHQLSNEIEVPEADFTKDLKADEARRLANLDLATVAVRATGSIIVLVGCGYEREAMAPTRVLVESVIRGRQVSDDPSGDVARQIMQGRRPKSLKVVAQRYGQADEIAFLDRFAHADPLSLIALETTRRVPGTKTGEPREIRPLRGTMRPATMLLQAAHETVMFAVLLGETFGRAVELPSFIAGQLTHYRDNPLPRIL